MKLNLGCGFNKIEGYTNVDNFEGCEPDVVHDLNVTPWPFEADSVDEIIMIHCLEHLGETTATYLGIIKEMYRVCKADALIKIIVPHWMHENFAHDPTHCRVVTPVGLAMFSKNRNLQDLANGGAETKLGLMLDVDFEVLDAQYIPDAYYAELSAKEQWTEEQIGRAIVGQPGACQEIRIMLRVVKQ